MIYFTGKAKLYNVGCVLGKLITSFQLLLITSKPLAFRSKSKDKSNNIILLLK